MKKEKSVKSARLIPFWSWNGELDEEKLCKQIEWMKENGFGGFFMHARSGLTTEYMGKKWFSCIKACAQKAKELGLETWAYDENGWPSGIAGGKMLYDECNFRRVLEYSFGTRDFSAYVSYDISGEELVRLMDDTPCDNCLNLYVKVCKTAVDCLDEDVVERFLQCTHERYQNAFEGKLKDYIKGFFTDEPTYSHFPNKIGDYFEKNYGEDVLDGLGHLFIEKKGFRAFRYKYYLACQTMFANNYVKKIHDWCKANEVLFTGHFVEEAGLHAQMLGCAGVMPLYEYMDMPGIDWLCRRFINMIPIKQLVSVCAQLNKRDVLTESFAMTGWDVTPQELRAIGEFQYMFGLNVMSQHLLPYSEAGWRKNDHPVHFSPIVPWMENGICTLNNHLERLGEWIAESKEPVKVAVLHPMRSAFGCFKRTECGELYGLDARFREYSEFLADRGIAYHYVDETILERHGAVDGKTLVCGVCRYDYLILPTALSTMGKNTEKLLRAFMNNGGKLLIAREKPLYLEGEPYDFSFLESNVTIEEIERAQVFSFSANAGKVRAVCREKDDKRLIHVLNIHPTECAVCTVSVAGKKLQMYDMVRDKWISCNGEISLKPLESAYIFVADSEGEAAKEQPIVDLPEGLFEVLHVDDNAMVLDEASFSFDGENYSAESYPLPAIFQHLLSKRYCGDIFLKFNFNVKEIPKRIRLSYEKTQEAFLSVNGKAVEFDEISTVDEAFLYANIASAVKCGENEIVEKIYFYQSEETYHCLYGGGEIKMPENTVAYTTYLESLRLFGDFGVYTDKDWRLTDMKNVFLGEDFYIGARKTSIRDMIFDGYPFFAGKIRVKCELTLDSVDVALRLSGRIHYAKLFVNNNYVGEYMFTDTLDISAFAKLGHNIVEIELFTGARNLLGPFHLANAEESFYVTPSSFVCNGWQDFQHNNYRKSYSLVRTGIFPYNGQFRLPDMDK